MKELLRPWKLTTFAIGLGLLIVGSFYWDTYDWDVGISVIMAVLAYVTAPWAARAIGERRWSSLPAALLGYWITVDGSYVLYNAWRGHPVSAELRQANFMASTALYAACGLLWMPRLSLEGLRRRLFPRHDHDISVARSRLQERRIRSSMDFATRVANFVIGNEAPSDLIEIAELGSQEGRESPSLWVLAGLNPRQVNYFEVMDLWRSALEELRYESPAKRVAIETVIRHWLRQIDEGRTAPRDGVREIVDGSDYWRWDDALTPRATHVGEALGIGKILGAYYQYDDFHGPYVDKGGRTVDRSVWDSELDMAIRDAARELLNGRYRTPRSSGDSAL